MKIITLSEFYDIIEPVLPRVFNLVSDEYYAEQVKFALWIINQNPELIESDKKSMCQALYDGIKTGLSLDPAMNFATIVPRYEDGKMKAVLYPMYQGLVKLITDTGSVKSVSCYAVYQGDTFIPVLGTNPTVEHIPKFESKEITQVYAVAELPSGHKMVEIMTIDDCHYIRSKSESYMAYAARKTKSCIWIEWEQEMCRKACIKRLVKYLPKTEKWEKLRTTIAVDNSDYKLEAYDGRISYIESLLANSILTSEERNEIDKDIINGITSDEASDIIERLQNSQQDPIRDKGAPSITEVNKAVRKKMEEDE